MLCVFVPHTRGPVLEPSEYHSCPRRVAKALTPEDKTPRVMMKESLADECFEHSFHALVPFVD